ncbi:hypothetical protein C1645_811254 [Glomus cerebriforme]|uniref:Uncharacterized protein n=1 Tax=Glomus cerebriforme TaxID=658196 RepID=A0A397TSN4_9GLOM|nr:hypothetical protein C1645_811254 [Glomus cerebriforme]
MQDFALSYKNYECDGENITTTDILGKKVVNKDMVCKTFHKSLCHLLDLIISLDNGIDLLINNETIWFYSRVSTIITDWPEVASFCLVYKFFNSNHLYYFCLVNKSDLSNVDLSSSDIIPKTHDEICNYQENNTQKSVYIEFAYNFFWDLP